MTGELLDDATMGDTAMPVAMTTAAPPGAMAAT
jgi:hypothetical protein